MEIISQTKYFGHGLPSNEAGQQFLRRSVQRALVDPSNFAISQSTNWVNLALDFWSLFPLLLCSTQQLWWIQDSLGSLDILESYKSGMLREIQCWNVSVGIYHLRVRFTFWARSEPNPQYRVELADREISPNKIASDQVPERYLMCFRSYLTARTPILLVKLALDTIFRWAAKHAKSA